MFISQDIGIHYFLSRILVFISFLSQDIGVHKSIFISQGIGELEYPVKCPVTSYFWSGFTTLQFAVEHTWLQVN